jgi:hypothetical protein
MNDNQRPRPSSMHRPSSRPFLSERRLREVGDWGDAGRYIGARWEEIGLVRLIAWQKAERPSSRLVPLAANPAHQAMIGRARLTNPDVLLGEPDSATWVLYPLDLKWTLELATYGQISGEALDTLLSRAEPEFFQTIRTELGLSGEMCRSVDGFFVSPPTRANESFLESDTNRRQEYPIESKEILFLPVSVPEMFSSLPGWTEALVMAGIDRNTTLLESLDQAERYYRLGAGVRGAIVKLATPLFSDRPAELDIGAHLAKLIDSIRPSDSLQIIHHLMPDMTQRQALVARLRGILKPPVSFGDLSAMLEYRGIVVSRGPVTNAEEQLARETWGQLHRDLALRHRQRVLRFGLELVKRNFTVEASLDRMADRLPHFEERLREDAQAAIDARLNSAR